MTNLVVEVVESGSAINARRADGTHLLTHRFHPDERPSFHPIMAPDGVGVLTQDSPDHHPWQHGLYTGFNLVNGVGFWKEQPGDGTFHPRLITPPTIHGSSVAWTLETDWRMPDGTTLVVERQQWTLTDFASTFELDLVWTLIPAINVTIGEYMAGGLFLRMPFVPGAGGEAINNLGQRNDTAERQRADWVAVSMPIQMRNDWGGAVIMDHPANPDYPVTWRVDHELGVSPSRCIAGSWTIEVGDTERYQYRVAFYVGALDQRWANARWEAFSNS